MVQEQPQQSRGWASASRVAADTGVVHIRDSKTVTGPITRVSREAWAEFVEEARPSYVKREPGRPIKDGRAHAPATWAGKGLACRTS
ncbi:DUF397 domain-containing protein [Streptomyces sp. G45]|uniref:DUF397 domain-containing protein n=1 Tax=Streptomyces sp. G45 TaxID=3406627 RepID=UPI003C2A2495